MAQLQVVLGYLRKHHFWLLCAVAVAASLFGWMQARGTLSDEYQKRKSAIDGTFGDLQRIETDEAPPNVNWTQAINKLTEAKRENVAKAWQGIYDEQQKVLAWPEVLGDDFQKWIKDPKNARPETEIPYSLEQPFRERYRNQVLGAEFPKLPKIVEAKLEIEDADKARKPDEPGAPAAPEESYKVDWTQESQNAVYGSLKLPLDTIPSNLDVRLHQEDLWVYQTLLGIIRKTNETAGYSSHVKRIEQLLIGKPAAAKFQEGMKSGHIQLPTQGGTEDAQAAPGAVAEAAPPGEGAEPAPDADRYVDDAGTPLAAGTAGSEAFKRLPVFLKLEMNQLEITTLLSHCVNSPLPVEVRQLRINPEAAKEAGGQARPQAKAREGGDAVGATAAGPLDATVEIHGIIYIYNPPDPAKLGQPAGAAPVTAGG
jgi:hypothetical protein